MLELVAAMVMEELERRFETMECRTLPDVLPHARQQHTAQPTHIHADKS